MKQITDILTNDTIVTGLQVSSKQEALTKLIELTAVEPEQRETVQEAIFEREGIISTGMGKGVAIPHCKVNNLDEHYCSLAILDEPIAFDSVDDIPVQILVLLVSPGADQGQHLRLMSQISRLLINQPLREQLLKLKSKKAVLNVLRKEKLKR